MKKFLKNNKNLIGLFIVLALIGVGTIVLIGISRRYNENAARMRGKYTDGTYHIQVGTDDMIWMNIPGCTVNGSPIRYIPAGDDVIIVNITGQVEEAYVIEFHDKTAKVFTATHNGKEKSGDWIFDYDEEAPLVVLEKD